MKPRKPIRKISVKRAEQMKLYAKLKRAHLKAHPICQAPGCSNKAVDLHHARGRIHGLLTDTRFFKASCRYHHEKVKQDPPWARLIDWLPPVGQWNTTPESRDKRHE